MNTKILDTKKAKLEIAKKDLTLLNFFATWCGPCQMFSPILEETAKKHNVVKVDFDENRDFATELKVTSVPTTFFFKNGKVVDQIVGYMPAAVLDKRIAALKA